MKHRSKLHKVAGLTEAQKSIVDHILMDKIKARQKVRVVVWWGALLRPQVASISKKKTQSLSRQRKKDKATKKTGNTMAPAA